MNESNNNGLHVKNINAEFSNEFEFKIDNTTNPPKKVLPESPIKTFDGDQFHNKNAASELIK